MPDLSRVGRAGSRISEYLIESCRLQKLETFCRDSKRVVRAARFFVETYVAEAETAKINAEREAEKEK